MPAGTGNDILDALPLAVRRPLHNSLVPLDAGSQLFGQGERITHAYFPTTAVCSLVVELSSGDKAETGMVGRDGYLGASLVLGMPTSVASGIVQIPGEGYRMPAKSLLDLCKHHEGFRKALFNYAAFSLLVSNRAVACNSFHSIVQRAARWLLFAHDRAGKDEFQLTHEVLSSMLAATRPRVSQAAAKLRSDGVIDYRRGKVRILDRARLEKASCECYAETRKISPNHAQ